MGLFRKAVSISTLGQVGFKSNKEMMAKNIKITAKEAQKQTKIMKDEELNQRVREQTAEQRRRRQERALAAESVSSEESKPTRLEQLKELGDLRDSGVLTAEEFELEKAKILST